MHVARMPNGRWRAWVKHAGETRTVTADTRAKVLRAAAEIRLAMSDIPVAGSGNVTVLEMLSFHLAARGPNLSPSTLAEYERVVAKLHDDFADRKVSRLRAPDLAGYYDRCLRDGWSLGAVRRLHELMHAAWKQTAMFRGWALSNPAESAKPPARTPHAIAPPSADVLRELFAAAEPQLRLYLRLSANTGARRGELVALRWTDIDLNVGELAITRSVVYTPASGVIVRPTKTGKRGQRRLRLGATVVAMLQEHKADQASKAAANGVTPVYVFSHDAGLSHWHPDVPTTLFGRLRRKTGAYGVRLHDLRHYAATQMLASGVTPVQAAGRLGHADPRTTMSVYAHWIPATDGDVADALDRGLD